jgi:uncharacterized protein involved in exopolysaccharide biosynthesis
MEHSVKGLQDYVAIVKRRRWHVLVPFVALAAVTLLVALLLPPVYRSAATILIEEPDVPRELVTSTITSFADQRLQIINQRVMATQNLVDIVRKYDLYAARRQHLPLSEVVAAMRDDIDMQLISAEVRDPRSGRATEATIAFRIFFDHSQPAVAQRVANELVSLYLSENLRERQEKSSETASFLAVEAARLERNIAELERQLADLKQRHVGALPEQLSYNMQIIARAEQELRDLDRQQQMLDEREIFLQSELSRLNPYGSYVVDGQPVLSPADQLKGLRTRLITLQGRYGSEHPDVVKLQREVDALEREAGGGNDAATLGRELERVRKDLALARERYTDDHPDVAKLKRQEQTLAASLARAKRNPSRIRGNQPPDNPAFIQLQAQLEAVRTERRAIGRQRDEIKQSIAEYEKRVVGTPMVEKEYQQLARAYESATEEYREIKSKQMAADLGRALETERKGERFSLIEPPQLPTEPIKPNRLAIIILGLLLAMGVGAGVAVLAESMDTAIYAPAEIAAITGGAPLVVIPYIRTTAEVSGRRRRRAAAALSVLLAAFTAVAAVHIAVAPLDVVWAAIERRIEKVLSPARD